MKKYGIECTVKFLDGEKRVFVIDGSEKNGNVDYAIETGGVFSACLDRFTDERLKPDFIWFETDNTMVVWEDKGWYAPRQEGAHESQHTRWYCVGDDPEMAPDTYTLGLGTPSWLDTPGSE